MNVSMVNPSVPETNVPAEVPAFAIFDSPYPDISHLGKWTASSSKFGFGVDCLLDNNIETYWHSDGPQPHTITVHFPRKLHIQKVAILLSFQLDDSYTPAQICIRAGTGLNDIQDIRVVAFDKPNGWIEMDLSPEVAEDGDGFKPLQAFIVQVIVLANHMNGKDTHIRGMKVLGPKQDIGEDGDPFTFTEPEFTAYETIR